MVQTELPASWSVFLTLLCAGCGAGGLVLQCTDFLHVEEELV